MHSKNRELEKTNEKTPYLMRNIRKPQWEKLNINLLL